MVDEFKDARKTLIRSIDDFPIENRESAVFDKWNLKDILSHLSGWAKYQADILEQFRKEGKAESTEGLKASINTDFVTQRKRWSWNRVYQEFLKLSENLVKEYENLPKELWKNKVYGDKETTVSDFIKIEINHYTNTHGKQIRGALKKLNAASPENRQ